MDMIINNTQAVVFKQRSVGTKEPKRKDQKCAKDPPHHQKPKPLIHETKGQLLLLTILQANPKCDINN